MAALSIEAEDSTYPFDPRGFGEPVRTESAACQRWFNRGLLQVTPQRAPLFLVLQILRDNPYS